MVAPIERCPGGNCGLCPTCDPTFVPPIVDDTESYGRIRVRPIAQAEWRRFKGLMERIGCTAELAGLPDGGEALTLYGPRPAMARLWVQLQARFGVR